MFDKLYTTDVLALAADIPHLAPLLEAEGRARERSMVCGSQVEAAVTLDEAGRIAALSMDVEACALGQASASVFARSAIGASLDEIVAARTALSAMLKADGPPPAGRFAGLAVLEPVRDYPARHASTMLAFKAGEAAMRAALAARGDAAASTHD